jgi:hypothetical protein
MEKTKMTIQIREQNCTTGEVIDRDMTADELAARKENKENADQNKELAAQKLAIKKAILDRLGLTEEEAAALLA